MRYLTIRTKLFILIFVVLIPLIVLQAYSIASHHEQSVESELRTSEDFANAVSIAFTNYLESLWDTELAISMEITSHPSFNADQIESYMNAIVIHQPTIMRYTLIGPDGVVVASTEKNGRGINLSDRSYFVSIKKGHEKVVSNTVEGRLSQDIVMPVTRGIYKDGKLLGIISAAVDVKKLGMVLPDHRLGKTSSFGIIDSNGMIVYRSGSIDLPFEERKLMKDHPAWNALRGEVVKSRRYVSTLDDTERMGVHIPISKIGWECFATISVDEVLEKYRYDTQRNIVVFIVVLAVLSLIAYFGGKRLLYPVIILKEASESIFNGDLSKRTNINGEDELAAAGKAFDRMAQRIQQLEESRRLFLQTSAHELRNPMAGIKGIISIIKMRLKSGRPIGDFTEMLWILEKEVDRLSGLLNEILEAFRAQEGSPELKMESRPVNLSKVIASSLKPFQIPESSHRFSADILEPVWIMGDYSRLEGVVLNLFGNAVKYSPPGSEIKVRLEVKDDSAIISVKDNGIGIPEGHLSRIFESFFRSDNMKGNDPGGMGLGLYICRDIVQKHGGTIWAENNGDKGSTFYVKFPIYIENNGGDKNGTYTYN